MRNAPGRVLCRLAEGEWSDTSSKLGITKAVDKFPLALGLVINMVYDPNEPLTKDGVLDSFTAQEIRDPTGTAKRLKAANIKFEFAEYLKASCSNAHPSEHLTRRALQHRINAARTTPVHSPNDRRLSVYLYVLGGGAVGDHRARRITSWLLSRSRA